MGYNDIVEPLPEELYLRRYDMKANTIKPSQLKQSMFEEPTFAINDCKEVTETNMASLKETAKAFQPKKTRNIADLEVVNVETMQVEDRTGTNEEGKEFAYKVAIQNGEEFRVPASVLGNIKTILEAKPTLKTVRVIKKGQGMNTEYTVIPLD